MEKHQENVESQSPEIKGWPMKKNKFLKKLFGFSISSWFSAIFSFVLLMISTHLYDQENLGKINFFISIIIILCNLVNLALDQGFLRLYSEVNKTISKNMISFDIILTYIIIVFLTIISLPFSEYISLWIFDEKIPESIFLIMIALIGLITIRFISLPYRADGIVFKFTIISIIYTICLRGGYIFSVIFNREYDTSIIVYDIVCILSMIFIIIFNKSIFKFPQIKKNKGLYKEQIRFSLPLIPGTIMSTLNSNVPQFIIRSIEGFSSVAIFSTSVTVSSAINLLQSGFNTFWAPYVFSNYKEKQRQIQQVHKYLVICMVFAAMCFVFFQDIIFIFFNQQYSEATKFIPFLVMTPLTYTIGETTQIGITIRKKTYILSCIYGLSLIINFILCFILTYIFGTVGAAISVTITSLITLTLKSYFGNKYYKSYEDKSTMIAGLAIYLIVSIVNLILYNYNILNHIIILLIIVLYIKFSGLLNIIKLNILPILKNKFINKK